MKKFYTMLMAAVVAISANAADYYLIGGFNNWTTKDASCLFTAQGDDTYVLDYNGTLTSGFKINDGTWSNDNANFGGSTKLVLGQTYTLTVGGTSGNISMDGNVENPHIVFNPTAKTLVITGQEKDAVLCYAIHGQIFGDENWSSVEMVKEENGTWTLTSAVVPGDFGIKEMDADTKAQTNWISGAAAEGQTPTFTENELGTPMAAQVEGKNWASSLEGDYTFTFDPEAMTLTVIKAAGITSAEIDATDAEAVYYNLQGVKVEAPAAGLFIEVRGTQVRKVVVK